MRVNPPLSRYLPQLIQKVNGLGPFSIETMTIPCDPQGKLGVSLNAKNQVTNPGSSAASLGLQPWDWVVACDGTPCGRRSLTETLASLDGDRAEVKLTCLRLLSTPPPPEDTSGDHISGILQLRARAAHHHCQKRAVRLVDRELWCRSGTHPPKRIRLDSVKDVRVPEDPTRAWEGLEFELVTDERTYTFRAPDQSSLSAWVTRLKLELWSTLKYLHPHRYARAGSRLGSCFGLGSQENGSSLSLDVTFIV